MAANRDGARTQRAALWRLHYETKALTSMLLLLERRDPSELNLERLTEAIVATAKRLKGGRNSGDLTLLAIAKAIRQFDDSAIAHGMAALRELSRGAARRLDRLLERSHFDRVLLAATNSSFPLVINYERNIVEGDNISISNSNNNNIANRSENSTQVSMSSTTLASPELLTELKELLASTSVQDDDQARALASVLVSEVEGLRRFDRAKAAWTEMKAVSPLISASMAAATLANALFGG